MKKFKIGDKVRVVSNLREIKQFVPLNQRTGITSPMIRLAGKEITIGDVYSKQYKGAGYTWDYFMLENIIPNNWKEFLDKNADLRQMEDGK